MFLMAMEVHATTEKIQIYLERAAVDLEVHIANMDLPGRLDRVTVSEDLRLKPGTLS